MFFPLRFSQGLKKASSLKENFTSEVSGEAVSWGHTVPGLGLGDKLRWLLVAERFLGHCPALCPLGPSHQARRNSTQEGSFGRAVWGIFFSLSSLIIGLFILKKDHKER